MPSVELPGFAVIADAHLHDIDSDYQCRGADVQGTNLALRTWADTRRSSRVFNESRAALETTLEDVGQRGIRHVVLLGDYTDDGQIEATERLVTLLRQYRQRWGISFYAIPGNHDVHGPEGKHQSTRFASVPGKTVLVTSSKDVAATESTTSVLTRNMYCEGTPAGLLPMAEFGLFRQKEYCYWETPFGQSDATTTRLYTAHSADGQTKRELVDASYLVEPAEGLWFLMIDANVFEPRNGQWQLTQKKAFLDSSDAGWNSLVRVKPFLIDWIDDVCSRATELGKKLYMFSHYPIIDPFDDQYGIEKKLFGNTAVVKRTPELQIARTLSAAGVQVHFGGHLHVNGIVRRKTDAQEITDIAVPSLVAFPPCYKVVQPSRNKFTIDTVSITDMPLNPQLIQHYREENRATDCENESALFASNYGDFLYKRMRSRVRHHYLPKEWPAEIACKIAYTTMADLARFMVARESTSEPINFGALTELVSTAAESTLMKTLTASASRYPVSLDDLTHCSMIDLITDWYCLRQAGDQALAYIDPDRTRLYRFITHTFGNPEPVSNDSGYEFFSVFLGELAHSLQRAMHPHSSSRSVAIQASIEPDE